ncbi:response regulator [Candidatus Saccharibacteria bacterium]|nr:response regulator [Candidatus Saccharibacteria bacterium]
MSLVYILEDDEIMAGCISAAIKKAGKSIAIKHFKDAISAVQSLDSDNLPQIIFLDILLTGPDGFTFLNEIASYDDTNKIPVVIISSLNFSGKDLSAYNVIGILNKETMLPAEITKYVEEYCSNAH